MLHYKLYTAGYITTAPPVEGLYITSYFTYITFTTQKRGHQQSTTHYNEELLLNSKLGQVSAMSSITSYVKESLLKLNSARFSEI
ncbi:hypothetical protein KY290_036358 [Solanum tuberosum]|uniref:Uncharacterized protein n=1 Tax=Solanum tuberosum TaxID=4113 RepID=A0ABQ7TT91_SOLTU|nr:hypothetical protein KY285_035644 [Solanum tuberosum]KAH0737653.1 hypothetical protein KY290_036358 [Solanum tuberosum]